MNYPPLYMSEMFPQFPQQQQAQAYPPAGYYPPEPPHQRAHHGLEIVGNELDHLLAVSGAAAYGSGMEIYGAAAYGALPATATQPPWMHQQYHGNMQHHGHPGHQFGRGVDVRMQPGTHVRRQSVGLSTTAAVAANGGTGIAQVQPQIPFRPEKLVVPSDIAGQFDITDVKVGKDSQFVAPGAVPARAFDEKAVDNLLSFHAVAISQIVSVAVVNNSGAAQVFKAYMAGTSVE